MSQRVVDVLEMVQVQEQHGQRTAPRLLLFNVALGALRQERTIGQIGEGVEMREPLDAVLRLALERDVAEQRDGVGGAAVAVAHTAHRQPLGVGRSVLAPAPGFTFPLSVFGELGVHEVGIEVPGGLCHRQQAH